MADTYKIRISGLEIESHTRFVTGNVLRRYLEKMFVMDGRSLPRRDGYEYLPGDAAGMNPIYGWKRMRFGAKIFRICRFFPSPNAHLIRWQRVKRKSLSAALGSLSACLQSQLPEPLRTSLSWLSWFKMMVL